MLSKDDLFSAAVSVIVLFGILVCSESYGFAQDDELSRTTLRGLRSIRAVVSVSEFYPEHAVTPKQLATDMEMRLRQAGLEILSPAEQKKDPGKVQIDLYVNVMARPQDNFPYYIGRIDS